MWKQKKIFAIFIFLVAGGFLAIFGMGRSQDIYGKDILAIVNDEVLSVSDVAIVLEKYLLEGKTAVSLLDKVISDLIDEKLIFQEAKRQNISVSEGDLVKKIERFKKHFPVLYKEISSNMTEEEYRDIFRQKIILEEMYARVIQHTEGELVVENKKAIISEWVKNIREKADIVLLEENINEYKEKLRSKSSS